MVPVVPLLGTQHRKGNK